MKALSVLTIFLTTCFSAIADKPWARHVIDNSSRGADGARLRDVNGDGLPDIATGWEEGGAVRAYLHPGKSKVRGKWPAVTVGEVKSAEDAIFIDVDGDGAFDVVSSCEGRTRKVYVHWAPKSSQDYLNPDKWKTEAIPATSGKQSWMYALPIGKRNDILLGAKGGGAEIGLLRPGTKPRNTQGWTYKKWARASWIMSMRNIDVDDDGDLDVLASDRKGRNPRVLWLENPGKGDFAHPWKERLVGGKGRQVMFLDAGDLNDDGRTDVAVPVLPRNILLLYQPENLNQPWTEERVTFPSAKYGTSKAVRILDLNLDGILDLAVACENANGPLSGIFLMTKENGGWKDHDLGGPKGVKFDRIAPYDLDLDGDLDLITCEERDQLGVVWYENPTR